MAIKKLLLVSLLLTACQPEIASEGPEMENEIECTDENGMQYTGIDYYVLKEASELTEEGAWYEIQDWELKFLVPENHEEYKVYVTKDDFATIVLSTEDTAECITFGNSTAALGLYSLDWFDAEWTPSEKIEAIEEIIEDDRVDPSNADEPRLFSNNFFDFQEYLIKAPSGSAETRAYFSHNEKIFAIQALDSVLLTDVIRWLQPL